MPPFDPKLPTQPALRLRLPNYNDDIEGLSKISREELLNPLSIGGQTTTNAHQLPYIYHFDIDKHRHPPGKYFNFLENKYFGIIFLLQIYVLYMMFKLDLHLSNGKY